MDLGSDPGQGSSYVLRRQSCSALGPCKRQGMVCVCDGEREPWGGCLFGCKRRAGLNDSKGEGSFREPKVAPSDAMVVRRAFLRPGSWGGHRKWGGMMGCVPPQSIPGLLPMRVPTGPVEQCRVLDAGRGGFSYAACLQALPFVCHYRKGTAPGAGVRGQALPSWPLRKCSGRPCPHPWGVYSPSPKPSRPLRSERSRICSLELSTSWLILQPEGSCSCPYDV